MNPEETKPTSSPIKPEAAASCSVDEESLMPERDDLWAKHNGLTPALAAEMCALAGKLEMERNAWKQHAWRESDLRERIVTSIQDIVTTDHESKEAFISRVAACLSPFAFAQNAEMQAPADTNHSTSQP